MRIKMVPRSLLMLCMMGFTAFPAFARTWNVEPWRLTADDFDANGIVKINFLKARGVTTSVCHRTYIYQDGSQIYSNQ